MSPTQICIYVGALIAATALIHLWNRGAQRRRFNRAYPKAKPYPWPEADRPFLRALAKAFRLPKDATLRLTPKVTPMSLYLTLYPEHCIYDTGECERTLRLLRSRMGDKATRETLAEPLSTLAPLFRD